MTHLLLRGVAVGSRRIVLGAGGSVRLQSQAIGRRFLGGLQHQHLQAHVRVHPDVLFSVKRVRAAVDDQQLATADSVLRVFVAGRRTFLYASHDGGVRLTGDFHAVHLNDPIAFPETGAFRRAAAVHFANILTAATAVSGRFRLFGVQVESVPVEMFGPGAQLAQSDGRLGDLLLTVVNGHFNEVNGRDKLTCNGQRQRFATRCTPVTRADAECT